jgi:DNA-binding protein
MTRLLIVFLACLGCGATLAAGALDPKVYEQAHPDQAKQMEADPDEDLTLAQSIAKLDQMPEVVAVLKKDGLSTHDYVVGSMALLQAGASAYVVKAKGATVWADLRARGINTDNVRFYMEHEKEIQKATDLGNSSG